MVERLSVGGAELAQNFRFAEQHRIEARGDAKEMADGVGAHPAIETSVQFGARDAMKGGEKFFHRVGDRGAGRRGHAVQLAAIAGGEHHRFFENSLAAQFVGGFKRLLGRERDALAKFHRRGAMVAADQRDVYARLRARPAAGLFELEAVAIRRSGETS